jgi:hypothetical protein
MPKKKTLGWIGLIALFALMLATSIVFLLASSVPSNYRTFQLTQKERKDYALDFVNQHGLPVVEKIRVEEPFTHVISEEKMNLYLASLDEIAFLKPARRGEVQKSGEVFHALDKAGLAGPVVAMDDGILTLMVRTKKYNKVVSIDLGFEFYDDGQMAVTLEQVRIGRMPVPESFIADGLERFQSAVELPRTEETSPQDLDAIIAGVLAVVNEGPFSSTLRFSRKRIRRIDDITVDDGSLKIRIVPLPRED